MNNKFIGDYPIRQDITVLPSDNPIKLEWKVCMSCLLIGDAFRSFTSAITGEYTITGNKRSREYWKKQFDLIKLPPPGQKI